ncbi:MAG: hypothetical protein VB050_15720 [Geobacteraceae bacterium]|nr:hypothetical protein [Geobacteraceae bacterium]
MNEPEQIIRDGWTLECPFCSKTILYTYFVNWFVPTPFFYSDSSNDVLLRKSDGEKVHEILENKKLLLAELEIIWKECLKDAPPALDGGQFTLWANVKCPHCKKELPYNDGVKDLKVRIYDSRIILIDGAVVVGDSVKETWQIKVRVK